MAQGERRVRAGCPAGDSLVVLPDPEALALAVAVGVVAEARRAVGRRGCFRMALSGGSTPRRAYGSGASTVRGDHAVGVHPCVLERRTLRRGRRCAQQPKDGARGPVGSRARSPCTRRTR